MSPKKSIEEWRLSEWREDAEQRASAADAHLVFADRIVRLLDALEECGSEGWASYAAEQERHAETAARSAEAERRASARVRERAEAYFADMGRAWGGDAMWLTSGNKVAALVLDNLRAALDGGDAS